MAPDVPALTNALQVARTRLLTQHKLIKQLTEEPTFYACVVATGQHTPVFSKDHLEVGDLVTATTPLYSSRSGELVPQSGVVKKLDEEEKVFIKFENGDRLWVERDAVTLQQTSEAIGHVVITLEGRFFEVSKPPNLEVQPGQVVKIVAETMQIIDIRDFTLPGLTAVVEQPLDAMARVALDGSSRLVHSGQAVVEAGDRVTLDSTASVITRNLGKDNQRFAVTHQTNVSWDDIGGLVQAKELMREIIELPYLHPKLYAFYNKKPPKGVLLYGPPGCGKTMLGKATATALARLHGHTGSNGYFYVKGPEILDKYVGETERTVRELFARARRHYQATGYPGVIFIDEADAVMGERGKSISSSLDNTLVTTFLTEMDGLEDSSAIVILATNRPDSLDSAVTRDGRIDRKIKIERPDQTSAEDIFRLYLSQVPLAAPADIDQLACTTTAEIFGSEHVLYRLTVELGMFQFTLANLISGAMIASIVDQATSLALARDLAQGTRQGIQQADLSAAIEATRIQNTDLNHSEALWEFAKAYGADITNIEQA